MANPFEKRASEYRRDDEAFLPLVTPDPLITFFKKHADDGKLYDQLSVIIGAPGSGKTTVDRLVARTAEAHFIGLSAVMAGVKDIRAAVEQARAEASGLLRRATVLFLDEVHRFNNCLLYTSPSPRDRG